MQKKSDTIEIDATGTISKLFRKYPIVMMGKYVRELQETSILGIAHVLRNVLMLKHTTFNIGINITCSIRCNYRMATTLRTLVTRFVSGM
jgi:hypothetical protein